MQKTYPLTLPLAAVQSLKIKNLISAKILWVLVIGCFLFFLVGCVFQVNKYTQEIYLIQEYEKKIAQLAQENKKLEITFSGANSLKNIDEYLEKENFNKIKKAEYALVLGETAMAK